MTAEIQAKLIGHYGTEELICQQAGMSSGKSPADIEGMIQRLLQWKHLKPFEIGMIHVEIIVPIWLDRQVCTYRTLVGSIANSGRYGSVPLTFHIPTELECTSSLINPADRGRYLQLMYEATQFYEEMVDKYNGVFPGKHRTREVFRGLLPQSQMTTRRFQVNLRNLLHFLEERLAPSAQPEIQELAQKILDLTRPLFPTTLNTVFPQPI